MAMVLEIIPNKMPVKIWIKNRVQKFLVKKLKILRPGKKISILGLKTQQIKVKSRRQIKKAKIPEIVPWIKNGPRIKKLEAPTNLWIWISSFWLRIANLIVLKVTKIATTNKAIEREIPALFAAEVREKILSMTGFLW